MTVVTFKNRLDQVGGCGLAFRSRKSDHLHVFCRMPEIRRRKHWICGSGVRDGYNTDALFRRKRFQRLLRADLLAVLGNDQDSALFDCIFNIFMSIRFGSGYA